MKWSKRHCQSGISAFLLFAAACGTGHDVDKPRAEAQPGGASEPKNALVNGTAESGDPWVGAVFTNTGSCTGTLVGRRTAITAAHCVTDNGAATICFYPCGNTSCAATCVSSTARVFPGFNPPAGGTDFDHDLAVLQLDSDVTNLLGIVPRRLGASPVGGTTIYLVGFGCSTPGGSDYGQKRFGFNTIEDIGSDLIDYDDTSRAYSCPGDSGGPAFNDGTDCQIGVIVGWSDSSFLFFHDLDYELTRLDTKLAWTQQTAADPSVLACGVATCGDGFCQAPEYCASCPQDCGTCPPPPPPPACPEGTIDCGGGTCVAPPQQCP